MQILAYCDVRYQKATREAVGEGALILTSPPIFDATLAREWFEGHDLIYLDLHGQPQSVYLYSGESQQYAALSLEKARSLPLTNAIVFATSCYLPETKFIDTFLQAGAAAVIAGQGKNYGGKQRMGGAQILAQHFIELKSKMRGLPLEVLLSEARRKTMTFWNRRNPDIQDAMDFSLWKL